jgi:hypothetical protein
MTLNADVRDDKSSLGGGLHLCSPYRNDYHISFLFHNTKSDPFKTSPDHPHPQPLLESQNHPQSNTKLSGYV